jgi:uncharacterized protein YacL
MVFFIVARIVFIIVSFILGWFAGNAFNTSPPFSGLVALIGASSLVLIEVLSHRIPAKAWRVALGLIIGVAVANLLTLSLFFIESPLFDYLRLALNLIGGYFGALISFRRATLFGTLHLEGNESLKILDTSVIIDGRIADVCEIGFVEGTLIIPRFVLNELRDIADSPDPLKRSRGRRGLDILNRIQKGVNVDVEISEIDFPNVKEVDAKLIKLAKLLKGKVVTNDYNLNKIAELEGAKVVNMNQLAEALKPVVLPGEELNVHIIKEGKEPGQGVGYLDDGTMVVVDNGKSRIGRKLRVTVTSVLQTAAGRMIFTKPQNKK